MTMFDDFGPFDDLEPPRQITASQRQILAEWGLEPVEAPGPQATLHDEPEPALPSTDGADEDEIAQRLMAALRGPQWQAVAVSRAVPPQPPVQTPFRDQESEEERGRRLLAYADAVARGETPPGPNPFEHVVGSQDGELQGAAAQYLAQKQALKTYSPAERQQIIAEGEGGEQASNLDRLDITGTHYEALEAASRKMNAGRAVPEDEDMWLLGGDPNMGD